MAAVGFLTDRVPVADGGDGPWALDGEKELVIGVRVAAALAIDHLDGDVAQGARLGLQLVPVGGQPDPGRRADGVQLPRGNLCPALVADRAQRADAIPVALMNGEQLVDLLIENEEEDE